MSFFEELKRRNVFRVGAAYVLMGWVALQGADFALDLFGAPNWVIQVLSVAVATGLPLALVLAWAFELTPEGVKRESEVDRDQSMTPTTGKKLDRVIIAVLAMVIIFMAVERLFFAPGSPENESSISQADSVQQDFSKSIAVLPFADLSQAGDQKWFADGLAEEILNSLARTPDLLVTSRTSSFKYRDSDLDITQIAEQLKVAHVLEGSVRQAGDRLRVTAQLIRAEDGFHLWSQNYDRDQTDMIAIQEDLAIQIARALETSMDANALAEMARIGTDSVEAYRLYLQARQLFLDGFTTSSYSHNTVEIFELVERALKIDAGFSAAHYFLADLWRTQLTPSRPDSGMMGATTPVALNHFHQAMGNAIRTSSNDEDQKLYRAVQALVDMRLREATLLLQQYLEVRPNDYYAWRLLTDIAWITHEPATLDMVLEHHKKGIPFEAFNASEYLNLAFLQEDLNEAVQLALESIERWPGQPAMEYQAHRLLLWAGEVDKARPLAARYPTDNDNYGLMQIRQACAEGRVEDARKLHESSNMSDEATDWLSLSTLGRQQEADELLQSLVTEGIAYQLADMAGYPQFGPMSFPSLVEVFQREGLPLRPRREIPFACPPPEPPSVAVLPFVNMSSDPEQEFFSDGISEEVLNVLTTIQGLKVAARTSSFQFKGQNLDVAEIGQKLGVDHLLEGSVRSAGSQVRVTAQLVQVSDGFHVWSNTWDRELKDIFAIQDEIATAIASELRETFAPEQLPQSQQVDLDAYQLFLKGRSQFAMRGEANVLAGIELLKQSVAIEPEFADATAALAVAYAVLPWYTTTMTAGEAYAESRQWAENALAVDDRNVDALSAMGLLSLMVDMQFDQAEGLLKRAVSLGPSDASAHNFLGDYYLRVGNLEKALEHETIARDLDPLSPVQWTDLANVYYVVGDFDESKRLAQRALEIQPGFDNAVNLLIEIHLLTGNVQGLREMVEYVRNMPFILPAMVTKAELYIAHLQGDEAGIKSATARRVAEAEQQQDSASVVAMDFALVSDFENSSRILKLALERTEGVWMFPQAIRLPEQAPESSAWQAFWSLPGPARLAEVRRANSWRSELPGPKRESP